MRNLMLGDRRQLCKVIGVGTNPEQQHEDLGLLPALPRAPGAIVGRWELILLSLQRRNTQTRSIISSSTNFFAPIMPRATLGSVS